MLILMLALAAAGLFLLVTAPFLARLVVRERDPRGLSRLLQALAVLLLVAALLVRPHNPETAAFPPPPDSPADTLEE